MRGLSDERGNVAIFVAIMLVTLMGSAALAIDLGAVLSQQGRVQTGADAAALAIAERCAARAVDTAVADCSDTTDLTALAQDYLDQSDGVVDPPDIDVSLEGDAGTVTVVGRSTTPAAFAGFIDASITELDANARAVARWGPLLGADATFPMALCKGVDLTAGTEHQLALDPLAADPPAICENEPDITPVGWLDPSDASTCTRAVVLVPADILVSRALDDPPGGATCGTVIDELFDAVAAGAGADDRTRVLAVTDRQYGGPSAGPAHALVAFEFTGIRLGVREAHTGEEWADPCTRDDVSCVRGFIREWVPPDEGPIADPDLIGSGSVDDTTVLHVRLVD